MIYNIVQTGIFHLDHIKTQLSSFSIALIFTIVSEGFFSDHAGISFQTVVWKRRQSSVTSLVLGINEYFFSVLFIIFTFHLEGFCRYFIFAVLIDSSYLYCIVQEYMGILKNLESLLYVLSVLG
ncbi:MAG: hypothetical protein WCG25_00235 [bacterium]